MIPEMKGDLGRDHWTVLCPKAVCMVAFYLVLPTNNPKERPLD